MTELGLNRKLMRAVYPQLDWDQYDREVAAETANDLIEDAVGNLVIAFRRYCLRTYGKVPSEDDFRAILRDAAVLAHHPADHSLAARFIDERGS